MIRLSTAQLWVHDQDEALAFYTERLGWEVRTDATLIALAEARPRNSTELIKVQGLGPTKARKYGDHVLAILAQEGKGPATVGASVG